MARGFDYETTLGMCWSKSDNDYKIYYPRKCDGWYIHSLTENKGFKEILDELNNRGYDTRTLRFSIKKKQ